MSDMSKGMEHLREMALRQDAEARVSELVFALETCVHAMGVVADKLAVPPANTRMFLNALSLARKTLGK